MNIAKKKHSHKIFEIFLKPKRYSSNAQTIEENKEKIFNLVKENPRKGVLSFEEMKKNNKMIRGDYNRLLSSLGEVNSYQLVLKYVDEMFHDKIFLNLETYNILIGIALRLNNVPLALTYYKKMKRNKIEPTLETEMLFLKFYSETKNEEQFLNYYKNTISIFLNKNKEIYNSKKLNVNDIFNNVIALRLDFIFKGDVTQYNDFRNLGINKETEKLLFEKVFQKLMFKRSNGSEYISLLQKFKNMSMVRLKNVINTSTFQEIDILLHLKRKDIDSALMIVNKLGNLKSKEIIFDYFLKKNKFIQAMKFYQNAPFFNFQFIVYFLKKDKLSQAEIIMDNLVSKGIYPSIKIYTRFLEYYLSKSLYQKAIQIIHAAKESGFLFGANCLIKLIKFNLELQNFDEIERLFQIIDHFDTYLNMSEMKMLRKLVFSKCIQIPKIFDIFKNHFCKKKVKIVEKIFD
jgi:pentatricopeptide repeat protein